MSNQPLPQDASVQQTSHISWLSSQAFQAFSSQSWEGPQLATNALIVLATLLEVCEESATLGLCPVTVIVFPLLPGCSKLIVSLWFEAGRDGSPFLPQGLALPRWGQSTMAPPHWVT